MSAPGNDFWSRRRASVQAEEAAIAAEEARGEVQALARVQEDKPDSQILDELGLKDPDLMQAGDDFAAFMQAAVPERLRRRALRRLWRSNPVLANLDGLVDHGEDYTDAATVFPGMKTTYQVGKGLLRYVMAQAEAEAAERDAAEQAEAEPPEGAEVVELLANAPSEDAPMPEDAAADDAGRVVTFAGDEDLPDPPLRRHMRFNFVA